MENTKQSAINMKARVRFDLCLHLVFETEKQSEGLRNENIPELIKCPATQT